MMGLSVFDPQFHAFPLLRSARAAVHYCCHEVHSMLIHALHYSIPHATSPPVHQSLSVSPTNTVATPAKESPLAEGPKPDEEEAAPAEVESA